ncbi:hypothetical protein SKAU_G00141240 [Synaphobranchus kaupii]|uniref:Uncharacterized protein n=1 Tax=Synaphobranchus kaupii TaxID=118154 RepID=A0A9Q1FSI9_SYNKA|nr:hypothetical protein SKAU_G00141240 [Synaphobranchus kaupii]
MMNEGYVCQESRRIEVHFRKTSVPHFLSLTPPPPRRVFIGPARPSAPRFFRRTGWLAHGALFKRVGREAVGGRWSLAPPLGLESGYGRAVRAAAGGSEEPLGAEVSHPSSSLTLVALIPLRQSGKRRQRQRCFTSRHLCTRRSPRTGERAEVERREKARAVRPARSRLPAASRPSAVAPRLGCSATGRAGNLSRLITSNPALLSVSGLRNRSLFGAPTLCSELYTTPSGQP